MAAITGGGNISSISPPMPAPRINFRPAKFKKMATTTEIIHAINFSIDERFVFVITYWKIQAIKKEGIAAKNENMDMKKNMAPQLSPSASFRIRKYITKITGWSK